MVKRKSRKTKRRESGKSAKTVPGDAASVMNKKLDRLERKIDVLRKAQEDTEDDVEESLDGQQRMEKDIDKMEKEFLRLGKLTVGREHLMELARGTAGAFIGVSVGMGLRLMPVFAENMEWANVISVLIFIFFLGGILVYKNDMEWIRKEGNIFIFKRVGQLFLISIVVVTIAFLMFNIMPAEPENIIKAVIVGSYPAMAGAITFTIT